MSVERFGSRFAFLAASIGMAVGAGNIWRFPRVAAEWGGGTFLIVCVVVTAVWAIPLLMAESLMGLTSRLGTIGAFRDFMGRKFAWMGGFVSVVAVGILFYYSVVCGWALRYFAHSLTGVFAQPGVDTQAVWDGFTSSPPQTIGFHLLSLVLVGAIVIRGLKGGFETVLKIALPALAVILAVLAIRAITLPGAGEGLAHLFAIDAADFGDARVWLEAFTQVAFSTGAGFGLYLTYSIYGRKKDNLAGNATVVAGSDLLVAVVAAVAVLASLYALGSAGFVADAADASGEGLAFVYFAQLFGDMPGGVIFAPLFFFALALATLSTLIALVELATRNVMNLGISRPRAVTAVVGVSFLAGIPSAVNLDFLGNQDFVWGIGLLVSGFFIALAMMKHGLAKARAQIAATSNDRIGHWWVWCIRAVPALFVVLTGWWIYQAVVEFAPDTWWNPFDTFSLATMLTQWGVAMAVVIALNGYLARKTVAGPMTSGAEPVVATNSRTTS